MLSAEQVRLFNRPGRLLSFDAAACRREWGGSGLLGGPSAVRAAKRQGRNADYINLPDDVGNMKAFLRALLGRRSQPSSRIRNQRAPTFFRRLPADEELARRGDDTCATGRSNRSASGIRAGVISSIAQVAPERRAGPTRWCSCASEDSRRPALESWWASRPTQWAEQKRVCPAVPAL